MKLLVLVGFILIAFNNFASAQGSHPSCDLIEILEAKSECVPPSQEEPQDDQAENESDSNSSGDVNFEEIEAKY